MRSMNRPIQMGGVQVCNDDVVFADEDGVIVVPRARWQEVEAAAWDVMSNEARIRIYAARGRDVGEILAECGAF